MIAPTVGAALEPAVVPPPSFAALRIVKHDQHDILRVVDREGGEE